MGCLSRVTQVASADPYPAARQLAARSVFENPDTRNERNPPVRQTDQTLEPIDPLKLKSSCEVPLFAKNFLCHMDASSAESCLRNIARLVTPDGFLFVSGIDLGIRTKVAADLGWTPLQEMLEEIHNGDPRMGGWPWNYSSLEPLNKKRRDWRLRYAAAFQLVCRGCAAEQMSDPKARFANGAIG